MSAYKTKYMSLL